MKELLVILLAGMMVFSLAACGGEDSYIPEDTEYDNDIFDDEDFDEDFKDDYDDYVYEDMNDVKKVNMVYGDDKTIVTLRKPEGASFTMIDDPLGANDIMTICANNYSWDAEIMGYKYYEGIGSNVPFVDYYFAGSVTEKYASYDQEISDLGISFAGKPVKVIRYTFKEVDDEEEYKEIFVGFEYNGTADKGLFGLKIYAEDEDLSDNYLRNLFNELTFIER